jgi:hypothetical protein
VVDGGGYLMMVCGGVDSLIKHSFSIEKKPNHCPLSCFQEPIRPIKLNRTNLNVSTPKMAGEA